MSHPIRILDARNHNQPSPKVNTNPAVWDLVILDIQARDSVGKTKYGVRLQAHNGRDASWDAYEEALDLVVYLRQYIAERDDPKSAKDSQEK